MNAVQDETGCPMNTAQAPAGVPSDPAHTSPAGQGGPLNSFSQPALTIPDREQHERTVHDTVSRTAKPAQPAKSALTANPNRTKAPTRQEVNR